MAVEARDIVPDICTPSPGGILIEFPRPLTEEEKQEVQNENLRFIQDLSLEQDFETIEKAQRDMRLNPGKRLIDLYFAPSKTNGHLSATMEPEKDVFGKPIFRHPQTRHVP